MSGNFGVNSIPTTFKSYANGMMTLADNSYKKGKDAMAGLIYRDTTEQWEDRIASAYATGSPTVWNDGELRAKGSIKEGYSKYFTQVPFGFEFEMGRLFRRFQPREMRSNKMDMGKLGTMFFKLEQLSEASLYNYAFSDTNTYLSAVTGNTVSALLPDGKRLASTQHRTSPDNATTVSNALTDGEPVGREGLEALLLGLHNQVDSDGQQMFYGQNGVIWGVTREQFTKAMKVIKGELTSGTTDNDINEFNNSKVANGYYNGSEIEVRLIPWLSSVSTTAHFAVAKEAIDDNMAICRLTNLAYSTDSREDPATKTAYVGAEEIFTVGAADWRGTQFSTGLDVVGGYTA